MTVKDWLYLGIVVASYAITIVAGIYAKNKSKINKTTTAGKVIDVIGQLATYTVHEAEYTGMDGADKRQYASEVVSQGLSWLGIKNVDAALINGDPNWKIALRDSNGHLTGKYIRTNTTWKLIDTLTIKGVKYYKLGTNQQLAPAKYFKKK